MNFEELTKEELIEYIKNINEDQNGKYGLIWDKEKEPEQIVKECDKKLPILKPLLEKDILKNDGNYNVLIEGDNFHSLTVLNYTHKEAIDIIYIDPPYNTGSDAFIYNDKFIDPEDGYRHSKWLNFMEKRLKLARNLLKEAGLIFISIDDNEFAQLKLLCDKIFGEKSFVKIINVELSTTQGMKVKAAKLGNIVKNCEYILVYSKDGHKNIGINPLKDPVKYDSHYNKFLVYDNQENAYYEKNLINIINENDTLKNELKILNIGNDLSEIYEKTNITRKWINENAENICRSHDSIDVPEDIKKNYKLNYIYNYKNDNREYLVTKDASNSISQRIRLSEKLNKCDDFYETFSPSRIRGDLWTGFYLDMGNVSKEGGINFDNGKKPVRLIKQILKFVSKKDATILDFFAGSGTTGQAVLEQNKEDGGNRKFILCTSNELSKQLEQKYKKLKNIDDQELLTLKLNYDKDLMKYIEENGICTTKTLPRLYNVINGYSNKEGISCNLKYFKTDFVENTNNRDQLYYDLTEKCIPMLCLKENCFENLKTTDEYIIYTNKVKDKYTCIYFDIFGNQEKDFINDLKNINGYKVIYKFSLGDYIDNTIFNGVKNYAIEAIPYKIVEVYRKLVKLSKEEN